MRLLAAFGPVLLVTACSGGGEQPDVPSADEDRRLNAAAEMLDANSVALEDVTDNKSDQP